MYYLWLIDGPIRIHPYRHGYWSSSSTSSAKETLFRTRGGAERTLGSIGMANGDNGRGVGGLQNPMRELGHMDVLSESVVPSPALPL